MPTYEYACKSCGEHLEVVQSFKDEPLTECPSCSGSLRKVFGNIGIAFKGSGFYKTDSRSASGAAKTASNGDSSGGGSSSDSAGDSAKKDTKEPAAKSDSGSSSGSKPSSSSSSSSAAAS